MLSNVLRPCVPVYGQVINPIGAVVKNFDNSGLLHYSIRPAGRIVG